MDSPRVECSAGHRDEETPRRFYLGQRCIEVETVIDCWLAPDRRYFEVRGDDGDRYLLRHEPATEHWQLILYDRTDAPRNSSRR